MVVEAPRIEFLLTMQLFPDFSLKDLDSSLFRHLFQLLFHSECLCKLLYEHFLVVEIDIEFKHVVSCQLLDVFLILFDFIMDTLDLCPSSPI